MKPLNGYSALLEIGVEELPARFIPPAVQQLKNETQESLLTIGANEATVEVWGSPRRLTVLIKNLPPQGQDRTDVAIGPPPAAAKDASGQWTPAALGFAKAQKVSVNTLEEKETSKGRRLVAVHQVPGQKMELILRDLFPNLVKKLVFPKTMTWEETGFRFARPLRWMAALYNSKVIRFEMAGVTSDRHTFSLLALGGKKIPVPKPDRYKSLLQSRCILIDPEERKESLLRQLESAAKRIKGAAITTPEHIEEVVHLTEYPIGVLGEFPEEYLSLPREVLITVMKKHQKFFPVEIAKGKLSHHFIGVRNGPSVHQEDVRSGYERVTVARLADAKFFFDKDRATPLDTLAERLSGVLFHEKLGSVADKVARVKKCVEKMGQELSFSPEQLAQSQRIAHLSKADLLTQMVGELPELQGIAGRFYADGKEPPTVSRGIEEHYWPLTADGILPESPQAALVAMADKLDTLAGHFLVGLIPTGSADPYAHRRLSMGVIRILIDKKWNVPLGKCIDEALAGYNHSGAEAARKALLDFFAQRCLNYFIQTGCKADEVEAVLNLTSTGIPRTAEILAALKDVRAKAEFDSLSVAIKRAGNILKQAAEKNFRVADGVLSPESLEESERPLYEAVSLVGPKVQEAMGTGDFKKAFLELAGLKIPVDQFFEKVMVMVEDEPVRAQRLRLLSQVKHLFDYVADFSKLQPEAAATKSPST